MKSVKQIKLVCNRCGKISYANPERALRLKVRYLDEANLHRCYKCEKCIFEVAEEIRKENEIKDI